MFVLAIATAVMVMTIAATATAAPIAQTQEGAVAGVDTRDAYEYRGVPFAAPPLGQLRWRPPVDAEPWAPDVYAATTTPPVCPQLPSFTRRARIVSISTCLCRAPRAPRRLPSHGLSDRRRLYAQRRRDAGL
ncbi:carboxylesterase [Pandoravirus inopinatum]|uniref:Carboxylesterase n=1 Tax=Pandoravirus inopinatum TaxID=1605721 RepID=A0A0B5J5N1_9VIRU|nr:carboxylesterase [Pandoravirus inopinatum]AJF96980.1 carboxylesterase [Pandoravirus inopinatum]